MMSMSAIQVKAVPSDVHEAARRRAAEQGLSLSAYILALVRRDLAIPTQQQWFAELAEREPVEGVDALREVHAARAERDGVLSGR
jgi:hypothetical protein